MSDARMAYSEGFNSPGDVSNGARHDRGVAAVVAWAREECAREPVSSVVPITRLREIVNAAYEDEEAAAMEYIHAIHALLDDVECASNPNNERTNNGQ